MEGGSVARVGRAGGGREERREERSVAQASFRRGIKRRGAVAVAVMVAVDGISRMCSSSRHSGPCVWSVFVDRALAVQGEKQKAKKKNRKEQSKKRSREASGKVQ